MKKIIAIMLVCLMVVPFGMLATTSISAADKTVYVSDAGDDAKTGADAANAVKTMAKAYELVGNAGTIVISGTYTMAANFSAPAHTGKITIKGADAAAKFVNGSAARFYLGGETEIKTLTVEANTSVFMLICNYHDLTIAEDVTVSAKKLTYLLAGTPSGESEKNVPSDVTVTINGGKWTEVIGVLRSGIAYDGGNIDGNFFKGTDVVFNIGGKAEIKKIAAYSRSVTGPILADDASCTINLNGGKVTSWIGMSDSKATDATGHGYAKGMTINISKNFDLAGSFKDTPDAGVFVGISSDTVWDDTDSVIYPKLGKTKIILDADIYDANKDNAAFRNCTVEKKAAGTTTPPETGDMTWVVAVVAAVSVMGCAVVVAKKRAN